MNQCILNVYHGGGGGGGDGRISLSRVGVEQVRDGDERIQFYRCGASGVMHFLNTNEIAQLKN